MNELLSLEQSVLAEGQEWTRRRLEAQAQSEVNLWGAICPLSGTVLKYRKRQRLKIITCAGVIVLKSIRGFSSALGRWVNPARERWGLKPKQRISPELQSRLVFNATATGSFEKAAATARRWGTTISDDAVHAVVQRLGEAAQVLALPAIASVTVEPEFSMVIMMDGWMVRRRGPDWGAELGKKPADRIEYKEVKSAVIYRLEQNVKNASGRGMLLQKYVVAAPPETEPLEFGAAVQAQALRHGLGRAKKTYVVIDGAVWLWHLAQDRFGGAIHVLDFHHASEHLWAVAHAVHGQGSDAARAWAEGLLHQLRHGQEANVVRSLEELIAPDTGLSQSVREAIRQPVTYFQTHRNHIQYGEIATQGGPIGSGSVESLCSQLQDRFKRTGQFWKPAGLRNLLSLHVLLRNDDFDAIWN